MLIHQLITTSTLGKMLIHQLITISTLGKMLIHQLITTSTLGKREYSRNCVYIFFSEAGITPAL